MICLFSDLFLDPEELGKSLNQFRLRRHEVVVFHVMHHDELEFPFQDNTLFRGMEVDAELHTEPRALRDSYMEAVERYMARVKKVCAVAGIDHVLLDTSKPLGGVLSSYLNFRAKSRRKLV
jgi:ABC-type molybdate transport system ATPase subunit